MEKIIEMRNVKSMKEIIVNKMYDTASDHKVTIPVTWTIYINMIKMQMLEYRDEICEKYHIDRDDYWSAVCYVSGALKAADIEGVTNGEDAFDVLQASIRKIDDVFEWERWMLYTCSDVARNNMNKIYNLRSKFGDLVKVA